MARLTKRQKRRRRLGDELRQAIANQYGIVGVDIADSAELGGDYTAVLSRVARTMHLRVDSFDGLTASSTVEQAVNVLMAG
ncbi:MAG: hypothetical protein HY420_01575 [Candidatus Kerfeldbacteria bacterium]|nr:hypothetical protein [Candidatus Kerfeldbacteria bacterium]